MVSVCVAGQQGKLFRPTASRISKLGNGCQFFLGIAADAKPQRLSADVSARAAPGWHEAVRMVDVDHWPWWLADDGWSVGCVQIAVGPLNSASLELPLRLPAAIRSTVSNRLLGCSGLDT